MHMRVDGVRRVTVRPNSGNQFHLQSRSPSIHKAIADCYMGSQTLKESTAMLRKFTSLDDGTANAGRFGQLDVPKIRMFTKASEAIILHDLKSTLQGPN